MAEQERADRARNSAAIYWPVKNQSAPGPQVTIVATMGEVSPPPTSSHSAAREEEETSIQDLKESAANIDPQPETFNTDRNIQAQLGWQNKLHRMEETMGKQEEMLATAHNTIYTVITAKPPSSPTVISEKSASPPTVATENTPTAPVRTR